MLEMAKILVPSSCRAGWKTRCPKEQQYDQTSPVGGESEGPASPTRCLDIQIAEIASGPFVALPAPHEDGAPTIEGLYKDELPKVKHVEIKEGTLRMLPDEWLAVDDDRDERRNGIRRR